MPWIPKEACAIGARLGNRSVFILDPRLFFKENIKFFFFKSWTLQRMSRTTKHVSKAGKVDPGDRVTLSVKFALHQS